MGMFDSFIDAQGRDWQTKVFDCELDEWRVGDAFPSDTAAAFQVEVISGEGSTLNGTYRALDGYVTIRDNVVAEVPADRDPDLICIAYYGGIVMNVGEFPCRPSPTCSRAPAGQARA